LTHTVVMLAVGIEIIDECSNVKQWDVDQK